MRPTHWPKLPPADHRVRVTCTTQPGEEMIFMRRPGAIFRIDQRSLAVHDFIVGKRQNEILVERIQHAEGQHVVVIFAMNGIVLKILERVVHPSHIPFQTEAKAADVDGLLKPWAMMWTLSRKSECPDALCRSPD